MTEAATRRCDYEKCGELFVPRKYWQRFCGDRCRMKHADARRSEALKLLTKMQSASVST